MNFRELLGRHFGTCLGARDRRSKSLKSSGVYTKLLSLKQQKNILKEVKYTQ